MQVLFIGGHDLPLRDKRTVNNKMMVTRFFIIYIRKGRTYFFTGNSEFSPKFL